MRPMGETKRNLGNSVILVVCYAGQATFLVVSFSPKLEQLGVLTKKLRGGLGQPAPNLALGSPRFHMKVPHSKVLRFHKGSR